MDFTLLEEGLEFCEQARLLNEGQDSDVPVCGSDTTVDAIKEISVVFMEQMFTCSLLLDEDSM
jgi:hypothetical protein